LSGLNDIVRSGESNNRGVEANVEFSCSAKIDRAGRLIDKWVQCKVDEKSAIIGRSDKCVITEDEWDVRGVELAGEFLIERHAVGGDFHSIDGGYSFLPVVNGVVIEFVGLGSEVDSVFGEFVVDLGELAPVGCLMCATEVFVGDDTNIDLFNGVFELVHKHIGVGFVYGLYLVLVHADERESDALDVEIVNHRMSEEVVGIEDHCLDSGIVKGAIGEDGEILVLIPCVLNGQASREVISAVEVTNERSSRNEAVSHLA
jgi:hypothetical protein